MNRSLFRFCLTLLAVLLVPASAMAEPAAAAVSVYKPLGVGLAIGLAGLGSGWAMSRIGAAGIGAIAEDQKNLGPALMLMALPESIVIIGFVSIFLM